MLERIKEQWKNARCRVGVIIFGIILLCALCYLINYMIHQKRAIEMYGRLQAGQRIEIEIGNTEEAAKSESEENFPFPCLENTINFEELAELNEDIFAWIEIPGTLVSYPVLQHPTDDSYYLNHTAEHEEGLPGSIYCERIHPKDFSAVHTVLYGHNMKNDTMFGSLHDYETAEKLTEDPYIYIFLPGQTLVYEIFAAVRFSDAYLPSYCDYANEEEFTSFIDKIRKSPGSVNLTIDVPYGNRILTLSTCIGDAPTERFLVVGVLIGDYET